MPVPKSCRTSTCIQRIAGFTLIELAVVVVVVGLLLGGMLLALSAQVEARKVRATEVQLQEIKEALLGFASAWGRLPCPASETSSGFEDCAYWGSSPPPRVDNGMHGFVPAGTLGVMGARNGDGLLVDAWGTALRYSVSGSDVNSNNKAVFVSAGEMRAATVAFLSPDLTICNSPVGGATDAQCTSKATTMVGSYPGSSQPGVPVVVFSLGPDGPTWTSGTLTADQIENAGESIVSPYNVSGPSGEVYWMPFDRVFVAHPRSGTFDDLVEWISPNVLYARMFSAGQLP